jgi:hypothetical protein
MGTTGEEVGYQDAIRQVQRSLQRRMKSLQETLKDAPSEKQSQLHTRISEIEHILQIVESLHR